MYAVQNLRLQTQEIAWTEAVSNMQIKQGGCHGSQAVEKLVNDG